MLPNLQCSLPLKPVVNSIIEIIKNFIKKKSPHNRHDHKIISENSILLKYSAYVIYFDPVIVGIQNKCPYLEIQARTIARGNLSSSQSFQNIRQFEIWSFELSIWVLTVYPLFVFFLISVSYFNFLCLLLRLLEA